MAANLVVFHKREVVRTSQVKVCSALVQVSKMELPEGGRRRRPVCAYSTVLFTFLWVILAPRGEQSRGADMSLGLVSVRWDSQRNGGTRTSGGAHKYT